MRIRLTFWRAFHIRQLRGRLGETILFESIFWRVLVVLTLLPGHTNTCNRCSHDDTTHTKTLSTTRPLKPWPQKAIKQFLRYACCTERAVKIVS